jgi:hypothetical protein
MKPFHAKFFLPMQECKPTSFSLSFDFIFSVFIITIVGSVFLHFLLFVLCLFSFDFFCLQLLGALHHSSIQSVERRVQQENTGAKVAE